MKDGGFAQLLSPVRFELQRRIVKIAPRGRLPHGHGGIITQFKRLARYKVEAMFAALESAPVGRRYNISEPRAYSQAEFRRIVAEELGGKFVVPLRLPMWAVYAVSAVAEKVAAFSGKASTLNRDKYQIMKQRNWCCTTDLAAQIFTHFFFVFFLSDTRRPFF